MLAREASEGLGRGANLVEPDSGRPNSVRRSTAELQPLGF
jgi:hypothetical protein